MKHKAVLVFLIFGTLTFSVQHANASVPKVQSIGADGGDDDVTITIEIEHSEWWLEGHYVDFVEATMDGRTLNFTDLESQTVRQFSLNGTFYNCEIGDLRVRAHCITHGWSEWISPANIYPDTADTTATSTSIAHIWSLEEMTEKADVILVGVVESITHHPADPNDVPKMHRKVQISVEYYLKNPQNSSEVIVLLLGGTIGNTTMYVTSQPEFYESDRVLLFLREDPWFLEDNPHGFYGVYLQGKIKIFADTDMSDFGFNVTDIYEVNSLPSSTPNENRTEVFILYDERKLEWSWYTLVVPLTMISLLVLMRWRKMIP